MSNRPGSQKIDLSGVLAWGANVSLSDVAVVETDQQPTDDEPSGAAAIAMDGADLTIERAFFANNGTASVVVFDNETQLLATDLVVKETRSSERSGDYGRGLYVGFGAYATVERSYFERHRSEAIIAIRDSTLVLNDTLIRETLGRESDGVCRHGSSSRNRFQCNSGSSANRGQSWSSDFCS